MGACSYRQMRHFHMEEAKMSKYTMLYFKKNYHMNAQ